jgi:tetratricopeptide (TPR) repeat protein
MGTLIKSIILSLLVAALGGIVYTRVPSLRLRATPSQVHGPYPTEESWMVNEVVRDVVEMATYPVRTGSPVVKSAEGDGRYRVSFAHSSVELDLHDDLWAPARFAGIARAALGARTSKDASTAAPFPVVHPALLDFVPAAIVDASDLTTRALVSSMRDARAHEAAALTLGAFALREAAGRFGDTRWALNRMTAHLALAGVLADAPGVDGRLADAVLLVLSNRQVRALGALDRLESDDRSDPVAAWARALRLRVTQDSRSTRAPQSASRLEQEEYVRARRATLLGSLAVVDLRRVDAAADAGWIRLIENSSMGVEDGWLGTEALDLEQAEYRDIFRRMHGRKLGASETDALNARATRCISGPDGPRVLPWGAWAEFAQRHLAMFIDRHDRFYRKLQGDARVADAEKERLTRVLGSLTMFPVATVFWTKGPRGGEADLTHLKKAVATALRSPERITPAEWAFLDLGSQYEPVAGGIPKPAQWFIRASPRVPQNAGPRLKETGHSDDADVIRAILKEAPYDYAVANDYLTTKYGVKAPYAEVRAVFGPRLKYDIRALNFALQFAATVEERLSLLRTSCDLSTRECISLGWELATAKREPEAVAAYRRAFDDPTVDAVETSSTSGWLVTYYLRHKQIDEALALAQRGADTQSWQGLVTSASLAERLGRFEEAEATYGEAARHYQNPSQLLGFYYRAVIDRKEARYDTAWAAELERVFPQGLTPVPIGAGKPPHGVVVNSDTALSRRAGLLIGDLIVGVEGHRVENFDQYRAVNAFFERDDMKLTVSRGGKLLPITVTAPNRYMGVELRSYPIEGWAEK